MNSRRVIPPLLVNRGAVTALVYLLNGMHFAKFGTVFAGPVPIKPDADVVKPKHVLFAAVLFASPPQYELGVPVTGGCINAMEGSPADRFPESNPAII